MGENIQRMLKFPETTVTAYADPVKGLADALAKPPDLVLLDMRMPGMSGEEVFARLHEAHPGLPIVFLTAFGSVESAVLAMRNGAFDYLQKPFKREDLLLVVKRALSHAELEQEVERLKGRLEALGETDHPQSRSAAMLELTEQGPAGRRNRCHRHDSGGERHGQGGHGPLHSQPEPAQERTVRAGGVQRPAGLAHRERVVRLRARSVHRRGPHQERTDRIGRWRHAVPGRDRRSGRGAANAPVSLCGGARTAALGRTRAGARGLPDSVRDQPGPGGEDQGRHISRRTLLPAGRGHGEAAAVARKAGRHPPPGAVLPGAIFPALRQEPVRPLRDSTRRFSGNPGRAMSASSRT